LNNLQEGFKDSAMKFDTKITCAASKTVRETLLYALGNVPKNLDRCIEEYRYFFHGFPFFF